ncbi:DUF5058 family protein [Lutispora saccharofermentans]|uniref:DUF5058 family protein n=1 Tax=Lutispora saccharofermentans TaxID=3024236 RepID=A0ABT1NK59_9FIRM|nr:DUF5058 family protein [Lutispora saccharofermentans]MCQ1530661.1 DUF5058 family protein [Lutispora saccharofermentans]
MNQEILRVANEIGVWLAAAPVVILTAIQAIIYTRLARKTARELNIPDEKCDRAFKTGLLTAIGPVIAIFIVMVGMMSVIGGPISWLRLSIIGSAPTELTAAKTGADALGVSFGGADYDLNALATGWWTMAVNGAGWLVFAGLFTHKLEGIRNKVGGGDVKWLAVLSSAAMLGVFGYLNSGDIKNGGGGLIAVIAGAISMVVVIKLTEKLPKLKEYALGIAMLVGMLAAVIFG